MVRQDFFPGGRLEDSISVIRIAVAEGLRDPGTRVLAAKIIRGCVARDDICEATSVFGYLQANVKYVLDPREMDTFSTLKRTLELGIADCDCFSIAAATLLTSIGFAVSLRVYHLQGEASWGHIANLLHVPKANPTGVIPFDLTLDDPQLNKEINAKFVVKHKDFPAVVPGEDWSQLRRRTA